METFNEYQAFTKSLATYNEAIEMFVEGEGYSEQLNYLYPVLAIAEEAGEVAGKLAKYVRKSLNNEVDSVQLRQDVGKELGDLLYQLSEAARQFDYTLQEIAEMNVFKLTDRAERGVIVGEGDNR